MLTTAGSLLVLLAGLTLMWRRFGRRGGRAAAFSYRRAAGQVRSVTGETLAMWLLLVACAQLLVSLSMQFGGAVPAQLLAAGLLLAVAGLVLARRPTILVLTLAAISSQYADLARTGGPAAATTAVVVALLVSWLYGLLRGFTR